MLGFHAIVAPTLGVLAWPGLDLAVAVPADKGVLSPVSLCPAAIVVGCHPRPGRQGLLTLPAHHASSCMYLWGHDRCHCPSVGLHSYKLGFEGRPGDGDNRGARAQAATRLCTPSRSVVAP
ncbi:uncharacterized protein PSFLO_07082 [Pseudozyma flocculosa]|uniref:Secreted protein n=1 Tax=Pseudozyma flocculosa TaxID=84751 RepID=A0A5C3FBG7_9BASI|nr:uncharacterized protein PSFLO_07082 [Pseudozyma flocculosa]